MRSQLTSKMTKQGFEQCYIIRKKVIHFFCVCPEPEEVLISHLCVKQAVHQLTFNAWI